MDNVIQDVILACDNVGAGYRVVELANDRHAFVWGNIPACIGDSIPQEAVVAPTAAEGAEVYPDYEGAAAAYRRCADALSQTDDPTGAAMLALLP